MDPSGEDPRDTFGWIDPQWIDPWQRSLTASNYQAEWNVHSYATYTQIQASEQDAIRRLANALGKPKNITDQWQAEHDLRDIILQRLSLSMRTDEVNATVSREMARAYLDSSTLPRQEGGLAKLDGVLARFDAQHAKYLYYRPAGIEGFLSDLRARLVDTVNGVSEEAGIIDEANWGSTFHYLSLSKKIEDTDKLMIVHELTHALDSKNNWNLAWYSTMKGIVTSSDIEAAEHLGYAAAHLFGNIDRLQVFEKNVRAGFYKNEKSLNDAWSGAWHQLRSFQNTDFYVNRVRKGDVTNEMIEAFAQRSGVRFSYAQLEPLYQQLVNTFMQPPFKLKKPANLPTAFQ